MLTCIDLDASRWGRTLFKGLGLTLMPGCLLAVLGERRAQAALLGIMAGREKPKGGMIFCEGKPIASHPDYLDLVLPIGPDEMPKPHLSVEENLQRVAAPACMEALVQAAMHFFKLAAHAATPCGELPAHLQRRVTLARLLILPRPVWLLDHPEAGLDEEGAGLLYALIANRCNRDGIVVTAVEKADFIAPILVLDLNDFAA